MPRDIVERWRNETEPFGKKGEATFRKNVEKFLDTGYGQCFLSVPEVADMVQQSLAYHHGKKYDLKSWVVMPNHLHFLAVLLPNIELREIAHSIKSYTAHEANKMLGRTGQFWQHEPFDRYIRNQRHYASVINYIEMNPVKAGLCADRRDWKWSSAVGRESE